MKYIDIEKRIKNLPAVDDFATKRAKKRELNLTKPTGSLGKLEEISAWCAGWQSCHPPKANHISILIFAGNHGVATRGVSAFPQEVTEQMVTNFKTGGAAINQLADLHNAKLEVIPLNLDRPTLDFTLDAAMTEKEFSDAFECGFVSVLDSTDILIVGEMGIGNTTSAAAVACALFGGKPDFWTGPGTGLDDSGVSLKAQVVGAGIRRHAKAITSPLECLRRFGGREMVAMAGAVLAARLKRVPVVLDGFVVTSACTVLKRIREDALEHCLIGHLSGEPGHRHLLKKIGKEPLLELNMRLGEASGAAVALGIIRAAIACHNGMSTFEEASIAKAR